MVEELEIEYLWDLLCDPTWSVITRGKSVPGVDMSPPTPGFMLWQVDLCKGLVLVSSDILASLLDTCRWLSVNSSELVSCLTCRLNK